MWEEPRREKLRSFRLEQPPAEGILIRAEALSDHRVAYLDYEGPVSRNRGEVKRWDWGDVESLADTSEEISLRLLGRRIAGTAVLTQNRETGWTLRYIPDSLAAGR